MNIILIVTAKALLTLLHKQYCLILALLKVLVEFDGASWEYRQWIKIYEQTKAFFVEKNIIWAARVSHGNNAHRGAISWPALVGLCS